MLVKYFAYIRDYTRCKEEDFSYYNDIYGLTHALCDKYGDKLRVKMLTHDGEDLGTDIIILVNGRNVIHLGGIKATLVTTDVVSIFPVVAGG